MKNTASTGWRMGPGMEPAPAQAGDPEIGRWHACPPQEGGGSGRNRFFFL
jgi:hypothetical protein